MSERLSPDQSDGDFDLIPEGTFFADLTDRQKAGIRKSIEFGRTLQTTLPTIAEDFRAGLTLDGIVEKNDIRQLLGVSQSIARNAVWFALRGYEANLIFADMGYFTGLMEKEEYATIARQHQSDASVRVGRQNRESGLRQYAEGKGIHSQTQEERKDLGRQGVIAQGSRPYEQAEVDLIIELAALPEYQRLSRINAKKIAEELNRRLHNSEPVRTPRQIVKTFSLKKERET